MHHVLARFGPDLAAGAVLRDPTDQAAGLFWLLQGNVEDGLGRVAGTQLFTLFQPLDGGPLREVSPGRLLDFEPVKAPAALPATLRPAPADAEPRRSGAWITCWSPTWPSFRRGERRETGIVRDYLRRSFDTLIARSQGKLMEYEQRAARGADMGLSIQDERRHLDDLRRRQATRLAESRTRGHAGVGRARDPGRGCGRAANEAGALPCRRAADAAQRSRRRRRHGVRHRL